MAVAGALAVARHRERGLGTPMGQCLDTRRGTPPSAFRV